MIVVSVDLLSAIHPSRSRNLAKIHISNIGGSQTRGDYAVQTYGAKGRPAKKGVVHGYPRESVAVLNLVRQAIAAAGYTK